MPFDLLAHCIEKIAVADLIMRNTPKDVVAERLSTVGIDND